MASSTIPALKANLQTQLQARAGLAGVQVSYGFPFPAPGAEWIWLADVQGEQEPRALGNRQRWEQYELTVLIRVVVSGVDETAGRAAMVRAFALMAEIENQLRSDASVNGALPSGWAQIGGPIELLEDANPEQRIANLIVTVACKARI